MELIALVMNAFTYMAQFQLLCMELIDNQDWFVSALENWPEAFDH